MIETRLYQASCHCGAVRFSFRSEELTSGRRCNCSICVRKGVVLSTRYYRPDELESLEGESALVRYSFGDRDVSHCFCRTCGIHPFTVVASVPAGYAGPARPGDYRINLGCVQELDVLAIPIEVLDGRSL
jgi:hypothetical protein